MKVTHRIERETRCVEVWKCVCVSLSLSVAAAGEVECLCGDSERDGDQRRERVRERERGRHHNVLKKNNHNESQGPCSPLHFSPMSLSLTSLCS